MSSFHPDHYFKILGVEPDATIDQIKKAYRKKARIYHPDINKRAEATDIFIAVNEAYEYLTQKALLLKSRRNGHDEMQKVWHAQKREEARRRAQQLSRERYREFIKSDVYKTSVVLNKTQLYINLTVSLLIISIAIAGYLIEKEPPSLISYIFLLCIGLTFFIVSLAHILAFYQQKEKIDSYEKKNK